MLLAIVARLLDIYSIVVLVAVVTSWIQLSPDNPIVRLTSALTEPLLAPIRRVLPDLGGLDLSPMVLLLGIQLLRRILFGL
jgi:YggT family protein